MNTAQLLNEPVEMPDNSPESIRKMIKEKEAEIYRLAHMFCSSPTIGYSRRSLKELMHILDRQCELFAEIRSLKANL